MHQADLTIYSLFIVRNVASSNPRQFCRVIPNAGGLKTLVYPIDTPFMNTTASLEFFDLSEILGQLLSMLFFNSYLFPHVFSSIPSHLGLVLHPYFVFFCTLFFIFLNFWLHLPNSQI